MKKKAETFYFKTVADMHRVPIEKLDAFVLDLKLWLQMHRVVELKGEGVIGVHDADRCLRLDR
jgi:hypothetical protein